MMASGAILLPASTAWARGDGWQPVEFPPDLTANCGSALVTVTFPVNMQYFRTTTLSDGTVLTQLTGALAVTLTAESGASVTLNISGPAKIYNYTNGDIETKETGLNGGPLPGMPGLLYAKGLIDVISHPDGSATIIQFPKKVTNICTELGLPG
jgi:hypothetical protein